MPHFQAQPNQAPLSPPPKSPPVATLPSVFYWDCLWGPERDYLGLGHLRLDHHTDGQGEAPCGWMTVSGASRDTRPLQDALWITGREPFPWADLGQLHQHSEQVLVH